EVQPHEITTKEQMAEIDDRTLAIADDATKLGNGSRLVQSQTSRKLEVGFSYRERLLDLTQVGIANSETLQDRPFLRRWFELPIKLAIDEQIGQCDGMRKVPMVMEVNDPMVAFARQSLFCGCGQRSVPGTALECRNCNRGGMGFELREVEGEREPAPVERLPYH